MTTLLDIETEAFTNGIKQRLENRATLINIIKAQLQKDTDFMSLPIWKKSRTGQWEQHVTEPFLLKSGAEKIANILGLVIIFPNLHQFQEYCLAGKEIGDIVVICQLVSCGNVLSEGIGARSKEQDWTKEDEKKGIQAYRDVNKALKMAKKASFLDAIHQLGGFSELFGQEELAQASQYESQPSPQESPNPQLSATQLSYWKGIVNNLSEENAQAYDQWMKDNQKLSEAHLTQLDLNVLSDWVKNVNKQNAEMENQQ